MLFAINFFDIEMQVNRVSISLVKFSISLTDHSGTNIFMFTLYKLLTLALNYARIFEKYIKSLVGQNRSFAILLISALAPKDTVTTPSPLRWNNSRQTHTDYGHRG